MSMTQPRYEIGQVVRDRKTFYKCKIIGRFWNTDKLCVAYCVLWDRWGGSGMLREDELEEVE